ncbi:MAG: SOS response-associated peptidase [Chloroflexi bacterium]|nr:SOS response-associated peptidase [Chloroflexota bacterium]
MCGRYTLTVDYEALRERFSLPEPGLPVVPKFNIAPTQDVLAVTHKEGQDHGELMRWGLIPSWAKDASIGNRMINARAESLHEQPAFRVAFERRRCLVPADGFYEWMKSQATDRPKSVRRIPLRFVLKSGEPFALAGIWEVWKDPATGLWVRSCAIITTEPNELMAPIHNRMPVILPAEGEALWLSATGSDIAALSAFLKPYPSERMEAYQVSDLVNSPRSNGPECIARIESLL